MMKSTAVIIINKMKLALGALALGTMLIGFFSFKALKAENARLQKTAATALTEVMSLKMELRLNQKALAARAEQQAALTEANEELKNQLEILYENDEAAKNWGGSALPDAIFKRLHH